MWVTKSPAWPEKPHRLVPQNPHWNTLGTEPSFSWCYCPLVPQPKSPEIWDLELAFFTSVPGRSDTPGSLRTCALERKDTSPGVWGPALKIRLESTEVELTSAHPYLLHSSGLAPSPQGCHCHPEGQGRSPERGGSCGQSSFSVSWLRERSCLGWAAVALVTQVICL